MHMIQMKVVAIDCFESVMVLSGKGMWLALSEHSATEMNSCKPTGAKRMRHNNMIELQQYL